MTSQSTRHIGALMTEILRALGITDQQLTKAVVTFERGSITVELTRWVVDANAPHSLGEVTKRLEVTVTERSAA
jgi:hypothetical protein